MVSGRRSTSAGLVLVGMTAANAMILVDQSRWYDRSGGRPPLVTGIAVLAVSGVALAIGVGVGVGVESYLAILPGLLLYGVGLALVLTTNDPVSLDSIAEPDHGQASGVSATAEQSGGAIGIAVLYPVFHQAYVDQLFTSIDASPLPDLTASTSKALRGALLAAEQTGLRPDPSTPPSPCT